MQLHLLRFQKRKILVIICLYQNILITIYYKMWQGHPCEAVKPEHLLRKVYSIYTLSEVISVLRILVPSVLVWPRDRQSLGTASVYDVVTFEHWKHFGFFPLSISGNGVSAFLCPIILPRSNSIYILT